MPLPLPEERVGTTIAEKYRLDRILGRGGMGVVFAGHHAWTDRTVAVKLLAPEIAQHAHAVLRFMQEARAAAKLRTPHVVDVLDMGREPDGTVYMVLELLEGQPLSDRIDELGKLSARETVAVLVPVMEALIEAHGAGITHRDLKPDNIFLSRGPKGFIVPKLLDFGVAKVSEATTNTKTGTMLGTPHYMSPEQVRGDSDVGPSADIWSMGVLLYECLSGELPYPGETTTGILTSILMNEPRPLAELDPALDAKLVELVHSTLKPTPEERPPTMAALLHQVRATVHPEALEQTLVAPPVDQTGSTALATPTPAEVLAAVSPPVEVPQPAADEPAPFSLRAAPRPADEPGPSRAASAAPTPTPAEVPTKSPAPLFAALGVLMAVLAAVGAWAISGGEETPAVDAAAAPEAAAGSETPAATPAGSETPAATPAAAAGSETPAATEPARGESRPSRVEPLAANEVRSGGEEAEPREQAETREAPEERPVRRTQRPARVVPVPRVVPPPPSPRPAVGANDSPILDIP